MVPHWSKADEHLERLRKASAKHYGDLFLNVGDAFVTVRPHFLKKQCVSVIPQAGHMARAVEWFKAVLGAHDFDNATVWLRLAHCLKAVGDIDASIHFYERGSKN